MSTETDLYKAAADYHRAKSRAAAAIIRARQDDVSWSTVGRAMGISKQAAQQKFGEMVTLATPTHVALDPEQLARVTAHRQIPPPIVDKP